MRRTKLSISKLRVKGELFWQVKVPKLGGGRQRRTFKDRHEAQTYFELCQVQQENFGTAALSISESLRVEAVTCAERLQLFGKTLREATDYFIDHLNSVSRSQKVDRVIVEFIRAKEVDGSSARYLGDLRVRLGRFRNNFGDRLVAEITSREISEWLRGLGVGAVTRNTFRRRLAALFNFARKQGYCSHSPLPDVDKAKERPDEIGILTPGQTACLLKNSAKETRPYWAIGIFCGLRTAELQRLNWEQVDLDGGLLEVTARNSKTGSRRLVPISPNLQAWLAPYFRRKGPFCPEGLRKRLEADRAAAGLLKDWPQNALRHSYGSYRLAVCQDTAKVALEMGNSPAMVFKHYRQLVRPAAAQKFWEIVPD